MTRAGCPERSEAQHVHGSVFAASPVRKPDPEAVCIVVAMPIAPEAGNGSGRWFQGIQKRLIGFLDRAHGALLIDRRVRGDVNFLGG